MNECLRENHSVIFAIVKKGRAKKIMGAAKAAGAKGCTTLIGKGTSVKEFKNIFGIHLEEDREMVMTIVKTELEDKVFEEIVEKGELNKPGKGIVFVVDLKRIDGIVHLLKEVSQGR